jgi:dUTP pyrophosphatase
MESNSFFIENSSWIIPLSVLIGLFTCYKFADFMASNGNLFEYRYKNNFINKPINVELFLKVKKLTDLATLPVKGTPHSAGYDLSSAYNYNITAGGKALIKTDIAIALPEGCYGRIAPRSSLAWKNHIDVGAGVIDADYRLGLGVVLFNHSNEDFVVIKGDRIAQLILERYESPEILECETLPDPGSSHDGFGSTGR